jgi:hypothetical protein
MMVYVVILNVGVYTVGDPAALESVSFDLDCQTIGQRTERHFLGVRVRRRTGVS